MLKIAQTYSKGVPFLIFMRYNVLNKNK